MKSGPDTSEKGVREAWFALEQAAGLGFIATASFVQKHVRAKSRPALIKKLKGIEADVSSLGAKAQQRWERTPFQKMEDLRTN